MTGQLEEEKMQVYVRLGIRLLYKGAKSQMEGGRARGLLGSLSIKQGLTYDAPQSAADIPGFIVFHNLKVDKISNLLDSFSEFFSLLRIASRSILHTLWASGISATAGNRRPALQSLPSRLEHLISISYTERRWCTLFTTFVMPDLRSVRHRS
ncbi:phosphatidylserine decarboxylase [Pleurotus ostreatus]|nr:phosphatidylserine decarboxylase [Pleurotus ostreatus]